MSTGVGVGVGAGAIGIGELPTVLFTSLAPFAFPLFTGFCGVGVGVGFRYLEILRPIFAKKSPSALAVAVGGLQHSVSRRTRRMSFFRVRVIRESFRAENRRSTKRQRQ
jgi:hypothetical protein